jgi:hypothetical protein
MHERLSAICRLALWLIAAVEDKGLERKGVTLAETGKRSVLSYSLPATKPTGSTSGTLVSAHPTGSYPGTEMAFALKSAAARTGAMAKVPARRSAVVAQARAGNWLPGSDAPAWLPESIPGAWCLPSGTLVSLMVQSARICWPLSLSLVWQSDASIGACSLL